MYCTAIHSELSLVVMSDWSATIGDIWLKPSVHMTARDSNSSELKPRQLTPVIRAQARLPFFEPPPLQQTCYNKDKSNVRFWDLFLYVLGWWLVGGFKSGVSLTFRGVVNEVKCLWQHVPLSFSFFGYHFNMFYISIHNVTISVLLQNGNSALHKWKSNGRDRNGMYREDRVMSWWSKLGPRDWKTASISSPSDC
jgi:hypothetical protein